MEQITEVSVLMKKLEESLLPPELEAVFREAKRSLTVEAMDLDDLVQRRAAADLEAVMPPGHIIRGLRRDVDRALAGLSGLISPRIEVKVDAMTLDKLLKRFELAQDKLDELYTSLDARDAA